MQNSNQKEINIRLANKYDINNIFSIYIESNINSSWKYNDFINATKQKKILVLEYKEVLASFILFNLIIDNEAEIYLIATKKDFRRKQLGSDLIKYFINYCINFNVEKIYLEVRNSNYQAINLYKKLLFTISFIRKSYYNNPTEDAIIMEKYVK